MTDSISRDGPASFAVGYLYVVPLEIANCPYKWELRQRTSLHSWNEDRHVCAFVHKDNAVNLRNIMSQILRSDSATVASEK